MALLEGGHCNRGVGLYSESPWIRYSIGDDVMVLVANKIGNQLFWRVCGDARYYVWWSYRDSSRIT